MVSQWASKKRTAWSLPYSLLLERLEFLFQFRDPGTQCGHLGSAAVGGEAAGHAAGRAGRRGAPLSAAPAQACCLQRLHGHDGLVLVLAQQRLRMSQRL